MYNSVVDVQLRSDKDAKLNQMHAMCDYECLLPDHSRDMIGVLLAKLAIRIIIILFE